MSTINKASNSNSNSFAKRWKALSGEDDWKDLLDPLDIDLRRYVIHYGERAGAIGDAFISETKSKNCGLSRYPEDGFFGFVGLEKGNPYKYEVTAFVYAAYGEGASDKVFKTSEAPDAAARGSNCVGYVAVATDEGKKAMGRRDILVVWRGSMLEGDWIADFDFELVPGSDILGSAHNPMVHKGWYTLYTATNNTEYNRTSAREQVFAEVKKLVAEHKTEELSITVAGHSMGAAMSTLNAVDMAHNKLNTLPSHPNKTFPLTAFVYACPRVGNSGFASVFSDLSEGGGGLRLLRVNELLDAVPHMPPIIAGYVDVGQLLLLSVLKSPYVKSFLNLVLTLKWLPAVHNLELHLHCVAGTQGIIGGFELVVHRDIGLMNKGADIVKDEYRKVVNWWTEKNRSMVQNDDGSWELKDGQEDYQLS